MFSTYKKGGIVKTIYLVTHGEKEDGPNPGLSTLGDVRVELLRDHLPQNIHLVVCGVGRRHIQTRETLELDRFPTRWNTLAGVDCSLISGSTKILLGDGTEIERSEFEDPPDVINLYRKWVSSYPDNTVIIGGRPIVRKLGVDLVPRAAALYKIKLDEGLRVSEVAAYGEGRDETRKEV